MDEVRVVNHGVDILLVNVYDLENERPIRREIDAGLASLFNEWKKDDKDGDEPFITT